MFEHIQWDTGSLAALLAALLTVLIGLRRQFERVRAEEAEKQSARITILEHERSRLEDLLREIRGRLLAEEERSSSLAIELASVRARSESERAAALEKLELLTRTERQLRETFSSLSEEALGRNHVALVELAREVLNAHHVSAETELEHKRKAVEGLVGPLGEQIGQLGEAIGNLERKREGAYERLSEQVRQMVASGNDLRRETGHLARALRAPQVRGRWGELQLRRVVELAGMVDHCDFFEQVSLRSAEGELRRPDLIVRLPGGRQVVVDAKAPLSGYLDALEAGEGSEAATKALREHARQLRQHVGQLASKAYSEQLQESPEFVVLFLPGEAFFSAALSADSDLIEDAAARNVVIATPTTLIALLKTVALGWQQQAVSKDARNVIASAKELHARLCIFAQHLEGIRKGLETAVGGYNAAVGSYRTRVAPSVRRLEEFGSMAVEPLEPPKTLENLIDGATPG